MKKTLLTIALMAVTAVVSFGQGTINPLNGALNRISVCDSTDRNLTALDGVQFTVVWGAAGTTPTHIVPGAMTIGTTAGVLVGLPAILALDGAGGVGTIVSLQIRANGPNGLRGETPIKQGRSRRKPVRAR